MRKNNKPNCSQDRPIKPSKYGKYNLDFIDWNNEWERVSEVERKIDNGEPVSDEEEAERVKRHLEKEMEKYGITIQNFPMVKADKKKECYICLKYFKNFALKLPCGHLFCKECLEPWLKTNSTCPTCKKRLKEDDELDDDIENDYVY